MKFRKKDTRLELPKMIFSGVTNYIVYFLIFNTSVVLMVANRKLSFKNFCQQKTELQEFLPVASFNIGGWWS